LRLTETDLRKSAHAVFQTIDHCFEEEVNFLQQLIRIPSENPPGRYEEITNFLVSYLRELGLATEVHETPRSVCKSAGLESDERRLSVKATAGTARGKPRILLLAHLDTVPAGDSSKWKHDPFGGEIVGNRIYGRGACDCKGRIAAYIFAQLALKRTLELPFEVCVAATADEEIGGQTGTKYLLEQGALDCDYCIGEGYTFEVFNGFKGMLWLRILVKGKSAHGATPQLGSSAVLPLPQLLQDIQIYQAKLGSAKESSGTTLNVGVVRAGTKINMVPDSASIELDLRVSPGYELQGVIEEISDIVENIARSYPDLKFSTEILNKGEAVALPSDHVLTRTVRAAAEEVTKTQVPVTLWFAHSDTVHFLRKDMPAVNYGVGGPGIAHSTDEYLDLDELKLSTKAVALAVIKLGMVH
jgi:acetylornithine deacetylase/succinyl-diaminopimelate desuccinylase family protein